jgi:monovalent cation:H+ antiporter, CPA1 family
LTFLQTTAVLLGLAASAAYCNYRLLRLPRTIGLMVFALIFSLAAIVLGRLGIIALGSVREMIASVDFGDVLLHGILAFLLFAGALHVDLDSLRTLAAPVAILATAGVVIATVLTAAMAWVVFGWVGVPIPLVSALLFGAIISPTDPVAVLGILKEGRVPKQTETLIAGESLFNDGIAIVVFLTVLETTKHDMTIMAVVLLFGKEVGGAFILGLVVGWFFYKILKSVDAYQVEILLTLALASGLYALAEVLGVSAPVAVVVAGLFIGNQGRAYAMSNITRERLDEFWELIDEILNAVLFLLIGLELLVVDLEPGYMIASALAVIIVFLSRASAIGSIVPMLRVWQRFPGGTIPLLVWGGLRGGISIAMALSLPNVPGRHLLMMATYIVVLFTVLVQGLTMPRLVARYAREQERP